MPVSRRKETEIYNSGEDTEDWRFIVESAFGINTVTIRAIEDVNDANITIHISPQRAYDLGNALLNANCHTKTGV